MVDSTLLDAEEYRRLCDYLYRHTGMAFTEARRYFVERRVEDRMIATGSSSFTSYFARLRANVQGELEQLINASTVNETYFYREDHQFACLTSNLLQERLRVKPRGETMRIWSVPCSTGEEPYSIAMWLLENWAEVDAHDIEIVGSDIDTDVLEAARAGVFGKRALMRLSPALTDKYFTARRPGALANHRRVAPVGALYGRPISSSAPKHSRTVCSTSFSAETFSSISTTLRAALPPRISMRAWRREDIFASAMRN